MRFNSFAHVNYSPERPLTGALLCINGAGSQYRWLRGLLGGRHQTSELRYQDMEQLAATAPPGADGLCVLPFGNGAERMLGNRNIGAWISGLNVNRHGQAELCRATLEGIAFAFVYGMEAMRSVGIDLRVLRVGNDNLFQSPIFSKTIASLVDADIEMLATTGAVGAAKGAGVGLGLYNSAEEAGQGTAIQQIFSPERAGESYRTAYENWKKVLASAMQEDL